MAELAPVHRFVDPGLNYLFTNNYDLSIRITPDGLSYTVFDTIKENFILIEEFSSPAPVNLLKAFGSDEYINWLNLVYTQCYLLKEKFNMTYLLLGGIKYTLMPIPLFDPAYSLKYLKFNHPVTENDLIYHDLIKAPESCLIYSIPDLLISWINDNYQGASIYHVCGSLIRNFSLQLKGSSPATRILANIHNDVIDILVFTGHDFRYCNSFYYSSYTDLLYYLLFVIEQLKINSEESHLFLAGTVKGNSEVFKLLNTYVRFVEMVPEAQNRLLSPSLDPAPFSRYFDLLNVSLCG